MSLRFEKAFSRFREFAPYLHASATSRDVVIHVTVSPRYPTIALPCVVNRATVYVEGNQTNTGLK